MTYQTVKTLPPLDAGYLAGLIDGEGTITLSRRNLNKHRAIVETVSNTEMSILNKRTTKANHTPSFTYQVANRQALDILKQTVDHLRSYSPFSHSRLHPAHTKEWSILTRPATRTNPV
jgi:hypothetical protein